MSALIIPYILAFNVHAVSIASPLQQTEYEEVAQVLQHFIQGVSPSDAFQTPTLEPTELPLIPDHINSHWSTNDAQRKSEKLSLLHEITNAMPELPIIHVLNEVFVTRCQGPLSNVVHTPTFLAQSEKLCECLSLGSPEAQAIALFDTIPMDQLASHILAVRISPLLLVGLYSFLISYRSHSPSILRHLYLGGLLRLSVFASKSFEHQISILWRGGHWQYVAFRARHRYFAIQLPAYRPLSCSYLVDKRNRHRSMQF